MGTDDKMRNQGQVWKGKAKEAVGKITDNERLEFEGKSDQAKGKFRQAMENVKDAFASMFGRRRHHTGHDHTGYDRPGQNHLGHDGQGYDRNTGPGDGRL